MFFGRLAFCSFGEGFEVGWVRIERGVIRYWEKGFSVYLVLFVFIWFLSLRWWFERFFVIEEGCEWFFSLGVWSTGGYFWR